MRVLEPGGAAVCVPAVGIWLRAARRLQLLRAGQHGAAAGACGAVGWAWRGCCEVTRLLKSVLLEWSSQTAAQRRAAAPSGANPPPRAGAAPLHAQWARPRLSSCPPKALQSLTPGAGGLQGEHESQEGLGADHGCWLATLLLLAAVPRCRCRTQGPGRGGVPSEGRARPCAWQRAQRRVGRAAHDEPTLLHSSNRWQIAVLLPAGFRSSRPAGRRRRAASAARRRSALRPARRPIPASHRYCSHRHSVAA